MRILQIIDSLEAGGAERMAVNYANALASKVEFSGIVVSRQEGLLNQQLQKNVAYCFIRKKSKFDFKAIFKLKKYVKKNRINIIHAHSTSFFIAFILKLLNPSVRLIWHDHYGDSEFLKQRPKNALKIAAPFFNGIIAVNQNLKKWSLDVLKHKNVIYLPNFTIQESQSSNQTTLKGTSGNRIVCLANLRFQKNHFLLLEIAKKIKLSNPDWTFHLVGKDFEDEYSIQIQNKIKDFNLEENVFIYGSKSDIKYILDQSDIGILTSNSEGLPLALLEYGLNKKPVVVTNVGEIPNLISDGLNGFIVNSNNIDAFYNALEKLINNKVLRSKMGNSLNEFVLEHFSDDAIIEKYLNWLVRNCK